MSRISFGASSKHGDANTKIGKIVIDEPTDSDDDDDYREIPRQRRQDASRRQAQHGGTAIVGSGIAISGGSFIGGDVIGVHTTSYGDSDEEDVTIVRQVHQRPRAPHRGRIRESNYALVNTQERRGFQPNLQHVNYRGLNREANYTVESNTMIERKTHPVPEEDELARIQQVRPKARTPHENKSAMPSTKIKASGRENQESDSVLISITLLIQFLSNPCIFECTFQKPVVRDWIFKHRILIVSMMKNKQIMKNIHSDESGQLWNEVLDVIQDAPGTDSAAAGEEMIPMPMHILLLLLSDQLIFEYSFRIPDMKNWIMADKRIKRSMLEDEDVVTNILAYDNRLWGELLSEIHMASAPQVQVKETTKPQESISAPIPIIILFLSDVLIFEYSFKLREMKSWILTKKVLIMAMVKDKTIMRNINSDETGQLWNELLDVMQDDSKKGVEYGNKEFVTIPIQIIVVLFRDSGVCRNAFQISEVKRWILTKKTLIAQLIKDMSVFQNICRDERLFNELLDATQEPSEEERNIPRIEKQLEEDESGFAGTGIGAGFPQKVLKDFSKSFQS